MALFLLRRLLWLAITTWVVTTVAFLLMHNVPGGPFDDERSLHPVIEQNLKARYHLDWPLWKQYLHYTGPLNLDERGLAGDRTKVFGGALVGELGPSFSYRDFTVNDIIGQSLPISVLLGSLAMLIALVVGIPAGIYSALRPSTGGDIAVRAVVSLGVALPNFVIATTLILIFAVTVPLLPVAGWGTPVHLILPSIALGAPFAAYIARLTRAGMMEEMTKDYVRAAVAKGLPMRTVTLRHALKAALLPVVSYLGPATAGILTGSLVIEKIFTIPGTGSHFVNSALNRDYTLAMGVTLLYTVAVFTLNTLVDMAYAFIDPRVEVR